MVGRWIDGWINKWMVGWINGWMGEWMDGRKDGWTEGGRQANCYYKEAYYHKYFKCPAINHCVFMTWTNTQV